MTSPRNSEDVLSIIPDVKQTGDYWVAPCPLPGHKTPAGHLTLKDAGDKVLITCQGGRHTYRDICQWLGFDSLTYSNNGLGGYSTLGEGSYSVTLPPKRGDSASKNVDGSITPPAFPSVIGITVAQLAEAKHLPIDFLKALGIGDFKYTGQAAVRIPYYEENGQETIVRFRLALSGDSRFKWRKGDKANSVPYGVNRMAEIKRAGWVLIVEGESDCWTAWHYSIPALGAPGKGIFPSSWGEYLKGLMVYVWQEPDADDFVLRILKTVPDLRFIPAPEGIKDISEAHIQEKSVPTWLEELKVGAKFGKELKEHASNVQVADAYEQASQVIESSDPLAMIEDTIRGLGYGGDIIPAVIVYLAATSRLLAMRDGAMPVHLLIMGASSSGKSYTLRVVMNLLPVEAYHVINAGSPRTIIYNDADLQHKVLVFGEADSLPAGEDNPAASAIRNLLQDHSLNYEVTIRDADTGDYKVRKVEKPGPTVLITTSTKSLGEQLMTRLFTLELRDDKEQIGKALETQAVLEIGGSKTLDSAIVTFQKYLQLKAPFNVIVPFAGELAQTMGKMTSAPRILRDFQRLLSLIKSVTIIRHHQRQTDAKGRLAATLDDYVTVRELVNDMYIVSTTGVTSEIRQLVEAVKVISASRTEGERVTVQNLATYLDISKMAASRRARRAQRENWLINKESRRGYPADFAIGESIPKTEGLPTLEDMRGYTIIPVTEGMLQQNSFKNGACNAVTPLTDDETSHLATGELPDCPVCGRNEWTYTPDGKLLCQCEYKQGDHL